MKVFISYAREDYATAKKLYDELKAKVESEGVSLWMDREDLLPGQKWKQTVAREIRESRFFIALLSSNSVNRQGFFNTELKRAMEVLDDFPDDRVFIIPVRIDECGIPDKLLDIHCEDLFFSYDKCLEKIIRVLSPAESDETDGTEAAEILLTPENKRAFVSYAANQQPETETESETHESPANPEEVKPPEKELETEADRPSIQPVEDIPEPPVKLEEEKQHPVDSEWKPKVRLPEPDPPAGNEYKPHIPKSVPVKKSRSRKPVFAVLFVLIVISAVFYLYFSPKRFRFTVITEPSEAVVKFTDFRKKYHPGIELEPGLYKIETVCKGYKTDTRNVEIKDRDHTEKIDLENETVKPPVAKYSLVVKTDPPDAEVKFVSPGNLKYSPGVMLEPGEYEIEVSLEGFETQRQPVVIKNGKGEETVKLEREKAELTVRSNIHGDTVYIDGKEYGSTPLWNTVLKTGKHIVTVRKEGYEPFEVPVYLKKDTPPVKAILEPIVETVRVETEPSGATVFKDGEREGISPLELKLSVIEKPVVRAQMKGYMPQKKTVEFPLESNVLKFDLEKQPKPPDKITNSLGMKFVYIRSGTFTMGSPENEKGRDNDEKQHKVTLTKGFYMQTTEVTVKQWKQFIKETGGYIGDGENGYKCAGMGKTEGFTQENAHPIACVSWNEAQAFIKWLNRKESSDYRLPTEAEWEYTARAGSVTAFANGDIAELECGIDSNLDKIGWYCGNSGDGAHFVAQKKPNAWDIYDMHGNVFEWCWDWYGEYQTSPETDPKGPDSGSSRVLRGGSWDYCAGGCRTAARIRYEPRFRECYNGFRLVALLPDQG